MYSIEAKKSEWGIYLALPISLLIISTILRATIFQAHWYFFGNFSISIIIIVFVLTFYKKDKRKLPILWIFPFQAMIIFLNVIEIIDNPYQVYEETLDNDSLADFVRIMLKNDLLARNLLGIFNGMAGVLVFLLNSRPNLELSDDITKREQLFHNLRTIVGLTAFLSFLMSAGAFVIKEPLIISWTIRTAILLFGFISAGFAVSLGYVFGYTKNPLSIMLGIILSFVLTFFLGVVMLPFTTGSSDLIFIAQLMFYTNTVIFTGIVAYMITFREHIYHKILSRFLNIG